MTTESIEKFVETQNVPSTKSVRIDFKKRNPLLGLIIRANDYEDLKSKNFWRFVVQANMEDWEKTKSLDYAKIYSGSEFTKLSLVTNKELA